MLTVPWCAFAMSGNAAPTVWAGRGHISACEKPGGTQPGARAAPPPLPSRTGAPAPRAPGRDVFLQTHSPGQSYINGARPALGAPRPTCRGLGLGGRRARAPPSPQASRPSGPGLSRRAAAKGAGRARAPAPETHGLGATRGLAHGPGPGRGPGRPPAGPATAGGGGGC